MPAAPMGMGLGMGMEAGWCLLLCLALSGQAVPGEWGPLEGDVGLGKYRLQASPRLQVGKGTPGIF